MHAGLADKYGRALGIWHTALDKNELIITREEHEREGRFQDSTFRSTSMGTRLRRLNSLGALVVIPAVSHAAIQMHIRWRSELDFLLATGRLSCNAASRRADGAMIEEENGTRLRRDRNTYSIGEQAQEQ